MKYSKSYIILFFYLSADNSTQYFKLKTRILKNSHSYAHHYGYLKFCCDQQKHGRHTDLPSKYYWKFLVGSKITTDLNFKNSDNLGQNISHKAFLSHFFLFSYTSGTYLDLD